jgi:hypothetical protein
MKFVLRTCPVRFIIKEEFRFNLRLDDRIIMSQKDFQDDDYNPDDMMLDDLSDVDDQPNSEFSPEQIERAEAAHLKRVKNNIAVMMSPKKFDAKKRLAAIRLLGELGEPSAIPYLVKIYKGEKDKQLQAAAKESLGMLKALNELLEDSSKEDLVTEVVTNVVLRGKLGKRANPPARTLWMLALGLIGASVLFFGISLGLSQTRNLDDERLEVQITRTAAATTPSATPTSNNPEVLLNQFRDLYTGLDSDARFLQTQLLVITRQQPQDCQTELSNVQAGYVAPEIIANQTGLSEAVTAFNVAAEIIVPIRQRFENSCSTQQAIAREDALTLGAQLTNGQRELSKLVPILTNIGLNIPATATLPNLPTNTPTPEATFTPSPTIDASLINRQILNMEALIDDMNGNRGDSRVLLSYWQTARGGDNSVCLQLPAPPIPSEVIVAADALAEVPELGDAATQLNTAIGITRASWSAFETACSTNQLVDLAGTQIANLQAADINYQSAQAILDTIKDRIR